MDRTDTGKTSPTRTVLRNPRIGFIGKGKLTPKETGIIWYIGRCIARLGHTVVLVDAGAGATALREGMEVEGGRLDKVTEKVIESSNHTLIYPDKPLLERLKKAYEDIETRDDVVIISNIDGWYDAVKQVLTDKGITHPD